MNTKILLKLADLLESQKVKGHFDLHTYVQGQGPTPFACGSTACAVGMLPELDPDGPFSWKAYTINGKIEGFDLYYGDSSSFELGVQDYLGIDAADYEYLFMPDYYPDTHKDARYVATRIRSFVKKYEHSA